MTDIDHKSSSTLETAASTSLSKFRFTDSLPFVEADLNRERETVLVQRQQHRHNNNLDGNEDNHI